MNREDAMKGLIVFAVLGGALALTGCLGGGGQTSVPEEVLEEDHERREALAAGYRGHAAFARQWGLERIGADQAYARIAMRHGEDVRPGAGVTVGIFDSGIDRAHPAFAHTRIDEVFLPGASDETGIVPSHGTAVASVIAGGRESTLGDAAHGVAWGANLVMFALGVGSEPPPDPEPLPEPEPDLATEYFPEWSDLLDEFDDENAAELRTVLDWRDGERRVDFLNLSVGGFGIIDGYTETELRSVYDRTIATIAQEGEDEKTVFVWAAGNENGLQCLPNQPYCLRGMVAADSPGYDAGLAARIAELRGHTVAVVAVTEDGEIAEYSNRCGLAADWCVAAPGEGLNLAWFGPDEETGEPGVRGTWTAGGTSFAAPMVTGGLALMKHRFRGQLSNTDLLARLLETADRSGRYADAKVYGRGLMDLDAATSPAGGERVATASRVEGPGVSLHGTRLALGGAAGDSLAQSLGWRELVVFDGLGAPFWHELGSRMTRPAPSAAHARLRDLLSARADGDTIRMGPGAPGLRRTVETEAHPAVWELSFLDTGAGPEAGHLGLAGDTLALRHRTGGDTVLSAFSSVGMEGALPVLGAELSWNPGAVGFRGGWLVERESALGTQAEGAFGTLGAHALFVGVEAGTAMGPWQLFVGAEMGLARPEAGGGMIAGFSPLATSTVALHAERIVGGNGLLRLSVAQPLRVETGRAQFSVPVGRTREGEVLRDEVQSSLVPSGRQVDLSAQWHQALGIGGEVRMGLILSLDPGHSAAAETGLDVLAGYRLAF